MRFSFPSFRRQPPASQASVPDGWRVYAIGDVHGCKRQLDRLLDAIEADRAQDDLSVHLVFLGDLVDRGPDSAGVIERLRGSLPASSVTFLTGNHEKVMLECCDGNADRCGAWLQYGGLQTLESYGLTRTEIFSQSDTLPQLRQERIPPEHISFMRTFDNHVQIGDYVFVHAGVRPGVPLADQAPKDLRWIRQDFLSDSSDHGSIVVHGHTITEEIDVRSNRIGVDIGCYLNGKLAALVLEGTERGRLIAKA